MTKKNEALAKTQARKAGNNGNYPPADKQFGEPNGNKQGHGFFKKENTLDLQFRELTRKEKE